MREQDLILNEKVSFLHQLTHFLSGALYSSSEVQRCPLKAPRYLAKALQDFRPSREEILRNFY